MVSERHCALRFMCFVNEREMGMKSTIAIMLAALLLAACGKSDDNKPILQKEHETIDKAKDVSNMLQQQAEKQKQAAEKQTQ
jgi:outer membrane lipoprotein-sorting protein